VTDDDGASRSVTASVSVSPRANQRPTAAFTAPSCTANEPCQFADASADSDGSVVSRSWSFEGGGIATGVNPVYTFPTAGTYSVTLTVTDDAGGTSSVTRSVTVTARAEPGRISIELSSAVVVRQGSQRIRLTWTGGEGSTLELYRNGAWRERVVNDGFYLRTRSGLRAGTYTYRLCERRSSNCSNSSSVTLP
jgi:serine protease